MDDYRKQIEINWTICTLFGGAERAARLTRQQLDAGWLSIDGWETFGPTDGIHYVDSLANLGFRVDIERLWEGAKCEHWHHRASGTVRTQYTRWAVTIEYKGGNRDGDEPEYAPADSFFGIGDTLTAAMQAALLDLDAEWAKGRSIKAALIGNNVSPYAAAIG